MKKETNIIINEKVYTMIISFKYTNYIRIRVNNGQFIISCPFGTDESYLKTLLLKSKSLIKSADKIKPFSSSYCYIYGEKQPIEDCFIKIDNHFILFNEETIYKDVEKYFNKYITERVLLYEKIMGVNSKYKVTSKFVKTRYGSNSKRTKTLSFNTYLFHFNKDIIDAIVVHELAHEFYFNHSKEFYDLIYKYCPNYKKLHKALTEGDYSYGNQY